MGGFSLIHWIVLLIVLAAAIAWPIAAGVILKRIGYSPLWCLLFFIPIVNAIGACVVAFSRWPLDDRLVSNEGSAEVDLSDPNWPPPGPTFIRKQRSID